MPTKHPNRGRKGPCPCGGTCRCHASRPDAGAWSLVLAMIAFLMVIALAVALAIFADPPRERRIRVDGRDCVVRFVETGRRKRILGTSRYGHDEAVCPAPAVSSPP